MIAKFHPILCLFFIACGSTGGEVSLATRVDAKIDKTNDPATKIGPSTWGEPLFNNGFGLTIEGQSYTFTPQNTTTEPIYEVIAENGNKTAFYAFNNSDLRALYVSVADEEKPENNFTNFGIEGMPYRNLPQGEVTYEGEYVTISALNSRNSNVLQDVSIAFNYTSGVIAGSSTKNDQTTADVQIHGLYVDGEIEVNIFDDLGLHRAEGQIFGANGETFVAVYDEPNLLGVIHAEQ